MKRYSIKIIESNTIVYSDIIKAHDAGHAIGRLSTILADYDHVKIECNIIEDSKNA